jgi:hypothetical protein
MRIEVKFPLPRSTKSIGRVGRGFPTARTTITAHLSGNGTRGIARNIYGYRARDAVSQLRVGT